MYAWNLYNLTNQRSPNYFNRILKYIYSLEKTILIGHSWRKHRGWLSKTCLWKCFWWGMTCSFSQSPSTRHQGKEFPETPVVTIISKSWKDNNLVTSLSPLSNSCFTFHLMSFSWPTVSSHHLWSCLRVPSGPWQVFRLLAFGNLECWGALGRCFMECLSALVVWYFCHD